MLTGGYVTQVQTKCESLDACDSTLHLGEGGAAKSRLDTFFSTGGLSVQVIISSDPGQFPQLAGTRSAVGAVVGAPIFCVGAVGAVMNDFKI